ncbi:transmembrane protein 163-like [Xenia sp. Carnegie-2017]|uniref:transmembrane protein 163-like n=1 Tax=Xenia sp. Carnegie-2017 TaxID=2897299 RepID=UPI001F03BE1E|nr:transmembrane protein 163-like [Xenia sp. Carnegie-2017]
MAVTLASLTLASTLLIALLAFLASSTSASSAAFGFGFDSALTSFSSFLIIWRFWTSNKSSVSSIMRKEIIATIAVASSMVLSAACVFARAYQSLKQQEKPSGMAFVIGISTGSALLYLLLFAAKYRVASRMGSAALMTDAVDALSGAILAFTLVISSVVLQYSQTVWFLDSSIALLIAVFSMFYGVLVLARMIAVYKDRIIVASPTLYIINQM